MLKEGLKLSKKLKKILWLTWKDMKHPLAGGAEVVTEELVKRLSKDGIEITLLTSGFEGCKKEEIVNGYKIIRVGNLMNVYWEAHKYYKKNLVGWADLVIEEINTVPFFCKFYVKEKNIILLYQLCREIWFYGISFPRSLIGFLVEPFYLYYLSDRKVMTISESTKIDLQKYGFKKDSISVFPIGLEIPPISKEEFLNQRKEKYPTMVYLGSIRKMKRPKHVLKAFELAKDKIADLKFFVVGLGKNDYAGEFFNDIRNSKYSKDITCFGKVSNEKKLEILKKSHVICVSSVKEGWGLIVTEANSCGVPSVVYDVDGLRNSCKNGVTGVVCEKNPTSMALSVVKLLKNEKVYQKYRLNAWKDSFSYDYERTYKKFVEIING